MTRLRCRGLLQALLLATSHCATAYNLDPNSTDSIISIAKQMTQDMLSFYNGDKPGGIPGLLPGPYYWWEAGAMMGALVDYWYYTKDDTYVELTKQGFLFQVGETNDYMPRNQTLTEGNDDQGFWGLSVMSAAEYNFPNPDPRQPQWLALAQAVFNTQAARWDTENCNGGLRWQIFTWNNGYDYKNSISQACFFALGARLALYTGNNSYAEWAERTWDWMIDSKYIDSEYWGVYDGASIEKNCKDIVPFQWSYNAGGFILGAAAMYNHTEDAKWKERLDNLLEGVKVFFTGPDQNIMTEVACEPVNLCNLDEQSFKAYLSRWLANITKWAPYTYDIVMPLLRASAVAAAKQCTGGANGRMCGLSWNKGVFDGSTGVGQQMAAMEVTLSLLIKEQTAPVTVSTGGTSKGDPGAGGSDIGRVTPSSPHRKKIGGGDRFGAAVVTVVVLLTVAVGLVWLLLDETTDKTTMQQFRGFQSSAAAAIAALATGRFMAWALSGEEDKRAGETASNKEKMRTAAPAVVPAGAAQQFGQQHGESSSKRVSSMPLAWAHGTSVRSSVVTNSGLDPLRSGSALYVTSEGDVSSLTAVPRSESRQ